MSFPRINNYWVFIAGLLSINTLIACNKSDIQAEAKIAATEEYTVVKVADGDTVTVRNRTGSKIKVRLACLDAPEVKHGKEPGQPLGYESKNNLQKLIDEGGGKVRLQVTDSDRYNRKVSQIFTIVNGKEKFLNAELVRLGLAYYYSQYAVKNCPGREAVEKAEDQARIGRVGVWGRSDREFPWDYRKRMREK